MASRISAAVVRPPCILTILLKKITPLGIDEKRGRIGGFLRSIPAESVRVRELITGIEHQIEITGQMLVRQKFVRLPSQVLRRAQDTPA